MHPQKRILHCYLLESVAEQEKWGCYTFLSFDPKLEITCMNGEMKHMPGRWLLGEVTPLFEKGEFCRMVERAKHHLCEGDIFQIVLSNRLSAPFGGSLFNTYRMLRTKNPSPYMFYFSGMDVEVAGASLETLVKLDRGVLHTFLLADEKELAEHNMPVDLGRISKFGTVAVETLASIERFSHVMHIGSTVAPSLF